MTKGVRVVVLMGPVIASCMFAGAVLVSSCLIQPTLIHRSLLIEQAETKLDDIDYKLDLIDEKSEMVANQSND